jgi:hypothetical protein
MGRRNAQGLFPEKFFEPRLFLRLDRSSFNKLNFLGVPRNEPSIQYHFHTKGREVDVPGFD